MTEAEQTKKKILIVDDEPDVVRLVEARLKNEGYDVVVAYDGQSGLAAARNESPDLIILDIMLPKLDGFQVCRMVKFDERFKKTPVIMFTSKAEESSKVIGKDVGAEAYVCKPFDHKVLLETVGKLLQDC